MDPAARKDLLSGHAGQKTAHTLDRTDHRLTDRKFGEEANALHASTVHSSADAIFSIDPDLIIKTWNGGAERLYGYTAAEAIGQPLKMICPEELRDEQSGLYAQTMTGKPVLLETVRRHKDGRLVPVGISGSPIFAADGHVTGVAAVHRDMTENREFKEHLGFTLRELSHRTKNLLAVVQGLARMIARRSDDLDEFEARFRGCVQALAHSHDLLVQHDWQGATLQELLHVQLAPFGGIDTKKITVRGPEVFLTPSAMQSLGLIMHELGTNATKHGALSTPEGSVAVNWMRDPADQGVTMVWQEQGGPPVAAPTRKGFGQVMFERIRGLRLHRDGRRQQPCAGYAAWCHHGTPGGSEAALSVDNILIRSICWLDLLDCRNSFLQNSL